MSEAYLKKWLKNVSDKDSNRRIEDLGEKAFETGQSSLHSTLSALTAFLGTFKPIISATAPAIAKIQGETAEAMSNLTNSLSDLLKSPRGIEMMQLCIILINQSITRLTLITQLFTSVNDVLSMSFFDKLKDLFEMFQNLNRLKLPARDAPNMPPVRPEPPPDNNFFNEPVLEGAVVHGS